MQRQQPRERGIIWLNVFMCPWYPRCRGQGEPFPVTRFALFLPGRLAAIWRRRTRQSGRWSSHDRLGNPASSDLNLSDNAFWAQPPAQRYAAYRRLRALESPPFFEAGESPFGTQERGYYALLRHADVAEASRNPQLFSSAAGATSIL